MFSRLFKAVLVVFWLVAWPPPLERVVAVPFGDRLFLKNIDPGVDDSVTVLTADGNVVVLTGRIVWRAGGEAGPAIDPAMRAAFEEAATLAGARHALADLLPPHAAAGREIASALKGAMAALDAAGAGLDVQIIRADITAALPPNAQSAADVQAQQAEAALAATRREAANRLQRNDRDRERILANAHAEAAERLAFARSSTATLTALETRMNQATRPGLLADLYRERIATILRQAGSVTTVDPRSVSKVIIPDAP